MTQNTIPTRTTVGQLKAALKRVTTATGAKSAALVVDAGQGLRVEAATAGGYASVKVNIDGPAGESCEAEIDASLVNVLLNGEESDTALTVTADARGARIRYARASLLLKKPTTNIEGLFASSHRKLEKSQVMTLTGRELRDAALSATTFMASKDVRYFLNGVHVVARNGKLVVEATDGLALATRITDHAVDEACKDLNVIIPASSAEAMVSVFDADEVVSIERMGNTLVGFKTDKTYWVSNLIEGRFPESSPLFTDEATSREAGVEVILSRKALVAAIIRVSSVAGKEGNYLKMQFMDGHVAVSSLDGEQNDTVPVNSVKGAGAGSSLQCSFSPAVLSNSLSGVPSDMLMIAKGISHDAKIFMRTAVPDGDSWLIGQDWKAVVMPARV